MIKSDTPRTFEASHHQHMSIMKHILRVFLFLLIALINSLDLQAQLVYTNPETGTVITISSDKGGVCGAPTGTHVSPFVYDNSANILDAFAQVPPGQYFKSRSGEPLTITVEVRYNGYLWFNKPFNAFIGTDSQPYLYDQADVVGTNYQPIFNQTNQLTGHRYQKTISFARADTKGWIIIQQDEFANNGIIYNHSFILPFVIEGTLESEVPIIGTTLQPQLPYFILHAPPGDGSTAEFQESKTVCREIVQSAATDNSNSGYVDVKIGVAGSIGFIATVDYEFSVTVGASAGGGEMNIETQGNQTCLTVTNGFQTPPGSEDVFVGYGVDLAYGVFSRVAIDSSTCLAYVQPAGLVYTPIGQPRQFFYTKSEIQDQIAQQQAIADDASLTSRTRNVAQNQVDVWNKVLTLNDNNINNPNNVSLGAVSFGTVPSTQESSVTVTETAAIEYEQYLDYTTGVDVVIEVGGSGVSGGYEYQASQRYGNIENQSAETTKIVRYSLSDDDSGDLFNVNIVRDPMFGTPVFRTVAGTKSSCPYESGYQRDQPKLRHDGSTDAHIILEGNPVGSSATFKVDLCNESNEPRTYNLKLNALSNLNGAVVSAAGVPLNGNDLGQTFDVPANSCVQDLVIEVKQLSSNSPLAYPNLELFMYAPCEEDIKSSVFASVYFGNATSTGDVQGPLSKISLAPNPASDEVSVAFDLAAPAPVRLDVRDLSGHLLMTGFDAYCLAGAQQARLDISRLPAGIYMLAIQSDAAYLSHKLVVER